MIRSLVGGGENLEYGARNNARENIFDEKA